MSHFVVLTLVGSKDAKSWETLENKVAELLAPYDESVTVEPYRGEDNPILTTAEKIERMIEFYNSREEREKLYPTTYEALTGKGAGWSPGFDEDYLRRRLKSNIERMDEIDRLLGKHGPPKADDRESLKLWYAGDWSGQELYFDLEDGTPFVMTTYNRAVWRWTDAQGREVAITAGNELLPGLQGTQAPGGVPEGPQEQGRGLSVPPGEQQDPRGEEDTGAETEVTPENDLPSDSRGVRGEAVGAEGEMRDLRQRAEQEEPGGGQRPPDKGDQGSPVHEMQYDPRAGGGRSGPPDGVHPVFGPVWKACVGGAKWDWYEIGGRWTGMLTDYDPGEDPENWETCPVCRGTGSRDDELGLRYRERYPGYACNGCNGKGWRVKPPARFRDYEGDVQPVANLLEQIEEFVPGELTEEQEKENEKLLPHLQIKPSTVPPVIPYAVITPDGEWHQHVETDWFGVPNDEPDLDEWTRTVTGILAQHADCFAVVVDCHI